MKRWPLMAAVAGMLLAGPAHAQTIGEDMALLYYFGRLDANKDGQVSNTEYSALFMAADTDRNGQVSLPEMMQQKEREKEVMFRTLTGKLGGLKLDGLALP